MGKMTVQFPCLVCEKSVAKNHEAICCDKCNWRVHRQCNNLCKKTYRDFQKTDMPWYCKKCIKDITPFSNLIDIKLDKLINGKTLIPKKLNVSHESFFDQINNLVENDVTGCKYHDIKKFKRLKLHENKEKFSLLHMNISSLPYHFDNFQLLLLNLKIDK